MRLEIFNEESTYDTLNFIHTEKSSRFMFFKISLFVW